jgi:iron complex outermembrane receptor protein
MHLSFAFFRTLLFSFVLFAAGAVALAQPSSIKGRVAGTAGPVVAATVRVLNGQSGTLTDSSGAFELRLNPGTYRLHVTAIGYASSLSTVELPSGGLTLSSPITLVESSLALETVVITGERVESDLIRAPLSVTALSGTQLQATRTWSLQDLPGLVPNYYYQQLGVSFQQIQSIRGLQVFSENAAVATYVDGVNNLDIIANGLQFTDIERIEVLRGPQGTLFGRNAMGGVVNIITRQPGNTSNGSAEISLGNLGLRRYSFSFRSPIVANKLFVGFAAVHSKQEGYLRNDTTLAVNPQPDAHGQRVGDEASTYGSLTLAWLPARRWRVTANAKAQLDESSNSGFYTSVSNDSIARANPDKIYLGRIARHRRNLFNSSLAANYYGLSFNLTSITTYQRIGLAFGDLDFGGGSIFWSYGSDGRIGGESKPQEVVTQELKITSTNPDAKLKYTAGAFGFWQNSFEPTTNTVNSSPFGFFGPIVNAVSVNDGTNQGIAIYGQASYEVLDKLSVTAGLRYDNEKRESTVGAGVILPGVPTVLATQTYSGSYSAVSPKAALAYEFAASGSVYASYTRGYRAGGVNAQVLPAGVSQTFNPEYSNNFEFGAKYATPNRKLQLSAAVFRIDWTDLQFFSQVVPGTFIRTNVGDALSQGIELEATWIPVRGLQLEFAGGWNNTKYKDFNLTDFFGQLVPVTGNRLSNAPEYTSLLAAQYTVPFSASWRVVARGELRAFGKQFTDIQNTLAQPAYALLNARVGISNDRFDLYFWVRNLTDERPLIYGTADTGFSRSSIIGPPVTYGVTLTTRF